MAGNDDKTQGTADEVKGRAQEAWGSITGNDQDKAEGQANQTQGKVEKTEGDLKNAVSNWTDNNGS